MVVVVRGLGPEQRWTAAEGTGELEGQEGPADGEHEHHEHADRDDALLLAHGALSARASAICTAFRAAPLRRLSPLTNRARPRSESVSWRIRPTSDGSMPAAEIGVGTSANCTP